MVHTVHNPAAEVAAETRPSNSRCLFKVGDVVTPVRGHDRGYVDYCVVCAIEYHEAREAVAPVPFVHPGHPATEEWWSVHAFNETHPYTAGLMCMSQDGWKPYPVGATL
jgi:hypothetical protein